jgi:CBS domain-containing protein
MKAADVMVSPVITVGPDTTVQEVADILLRNRISAVPVLSQQGTRFTLQDEYVKSHSRKVTDIMTSDVLTVSPDTPLGDIASVLEKNGIKRVPVVTDGKLVGIVSRANLLQAIATIGKTIKTQGAVSDAALREKVVDQLDSVPLARPALVNVIVNDGNIELWGIVESESEKRAARVAAEATPGVGAVVDHLMISRVKLFGE